MAHRPHTAVVTGASGGIGRATALEFARSGYSLVITARRGGALEELAGECRGYGAEVLVAPADVTDAAAMEMIARRAVSRFGSLDVWVNNAAVGAYGRVEEMPADLWRRVVEVDLFGYYHGVRAALPWFRERGHGVLINVASFLGKTPAPFQSPYVVSKYGTRALSDCARQEARDTEGIAVCTVLPGAVDTPFYRNAANVSGHRVKPPSPAIDPGRVARAIVRCARHPRAEVFVGTTTRAGLLANRLLPRLTERLLGRIAQRTQFTEQATAPTDGNAFQPSPAGARIEGGWREPEGARRTGRTALIRAGAATAAAAAVAAAGIRSVRAARERGT
jgi:short-subunit dehydrogenase